MSRCRGDSVRKHKYSLAFACCNRRLEAAATSGKIILKGGELLKLRSTHISTARMKGKETDELISFWRGEVKSLVIIEANLLI